MFLEVCLTQDHVPHAASHGSLLLGPYPREALAPALPPGYFRGASTASAPLPTLRPWASVSKAPSGILVPLDFQATKVAPHSLQPSRISEPCCVQNHVVLWTDIGLVTLSSALLLFVIQAPKVGLDSANTLWKQLQLLCTLLFLRAQICGSWGCGLRGQFQGM